MSGIVSDGYIGFAGQLARDEVVRKFLRRRGDMLTPVVVVPEPDLRSGGVNALRGFFSVVANVAAEGFDVQVVQRTQSVEPVQLPIAERDGYCYLKAVRSEHVDSVASEFGYKPLLHDLARVSWDVLRTRDELAAIRFTVRDGVAHLHDGSGPGVTAWDAITAVKCGTATVDEGLRVGSDNVPVVALPGAGLNPLPPQVVVDNWMKTSPMFGATMGSMSDRDDAADVARGHTMTHESCITTWLTRNLGREVVLGAVTLRDVVSNRQFSQMVKINNGVSEIGKRKISLIDAGCGIHIVDGYVRSAVGLRGVWRGTLAELSSAGGAWLDSLQLCGDAIGGIMFPVKPLVDDTRMYCDACGFDVVAHDHEVRCRLPIRKTPTDRNLAWLGDAMHVYDVRAALLEAGAPESLLTIRMVTYVSSNAQAGYMRDHVLMPDDIKDAGDTVLSRVFEASYKDVFRSGYVAWLRGQLGLSTADGDVASVRVSRAMGDMHTEVMTAVAQYGSPVVAAFSDGLRTSVSKGDNNSGGSVASSYDEVLGSLSSLRVSGRAVDDVSDSSADDYYGRFGLRKKGKEKEAVVAGPSSVARDGAASHQLPQAVDGIGRNAKRLPYSEQNVVTMFARYGHDTLRQDALRFGWYPRTEAGYNRVFDHLDTVHRTKFANPDAKLRCKDLKSRPLVPVYGTIAGDR